MIKFPSIASIFTKAFFTLLPIVTPFVAKAQVAMPYVPPEWHSEKRWLRGNSISFCVWSVSPTAEIDRAVARAIGDSLLLKTEIYDFTRETSMDGEELWETVFAQLAEKCDAVMGFTMTTTLQIGWLMPSRPYYEAPFILVAREGKELSLTDFPAGALVASPQSTEMDQAFSEWLRLQPARRFVRLPFPSNAPVLEFLAQDRVQAAFIWAPLYEKQKAALGGDAHFAQIDPQPLAMPSIPIGMMMREYNSFLRDQIDQAIQNLTTQGRLQETITNTTPPLYGSSSP